MGLPRVSSPLSSGGATGTFVSGEEISFASEGVGFVIAAAAASKRKEAAPPGFRTGDVVGREASTDGEGIDGAADPWP